MVKDELGDQIKAYEKTFDYELPPNEPVILRLDGHAFHTFTAKMKFKTPFDGAFKEMMYESARSVLQFCSGSMLAYVQSDEITVLLRNELNEKMTPFFNNRIQKLCSVVASVCSTRFNRIKDITYGHPDDVAVFDCRCFVAPRDKIASIFDWRQRDAIKNAINSVIYWKERETSSGKKTQRNLDEITTSEKKTILLEKYCIDINDFPMHFIRGACVFKVMRTTPIEQYVSKSIIEKFKKQGQNVERSCWDVDYNVPIFQDHPEYIERFLR